MKSKASIQQYQLTTEPTKPTIFSHTQYSGMIKISYCKSTQKYKIFIRDNILHTKDNYLGFIALERKASKLGSYYINFSPRTLPRAATLPKAVRSVLVTLEEILGGDLLFTKTDHKTYWISYYD